MVRLQRSLIETAEKLLTKLSELRGEDIIGLLVVRRRTPGSFPQNTVDLIKTFAAQSADE